METRCDKCGVCIEINDDIYSAELNVRNIDDIAFTLEYQCDNAVDADNEQGWECCGNYITVEYNYEVVNVNIEQEEV